MNIKLLFLLSFSLFFNSYATFNLQDMQEQVIINQYEHQTVENFTCKIVYLKTPIFCIAPEYRKLLEGKSLIMHSHLAYFSNPPFEKLHFNFNSTNILPYEQKFYTLPTKAYTSLIFKVWYKNNKVEKQLLRMKKVWSKFNGNLSVEQLDKWKQIFTKTSDWYNNHRSYLSPIPLSSVEKRN